MYAFSPSNELVRLWWVTVGLSYRFSKKSFSVAHHAKHEQTIDDSEIDCTKRTGDRLKQA